MRRNSFALGLCITLFLGFSLACDTGTAEPETVGEEAADGAEEGEGAENDGDPDEEVCCEVLEAGDGDEPDKKFVAMTRKGCVETGNTVTDPDACGEEPVEEAKPTPKPKNTGSSRTVKRKK